MKHNAPQFDLPGTQDAFNLSGECQRTPEQANAAPAQPQEQHGPPADEVTLLQFPSFVQVWREGGNEAKLLGTIATPYEPQSAAWWTEQIQAVVRGAKE